MNNEWKTIELPEINKWYLVTREDGTVNTGFFFEDGTWREGHNSKVIAWQELPKAYEVKEQPIKAKIKLTHTVEFIAEGKEIDVIQDWCSDKTPEDIVRICDRNGKVVVQEFDDEIIVLDEDESKRAEAHIEVASHVVFCDGRK